MALDNHWMDIIKGGAAGPVKVAQTTDKGGERGGSRNRRQNRSISSRIRSVSGKIRRNSSSF